MSEYVNKEEVINYITEIEKWLLDNNHVDFYKIFDKLLNFKNYICSHSIEVKDNKEGFWVLETEPDGTPYCYHCSICDKDFHYIGITEASDYCPNCGARMDRSKIILDYKEWLKNRWTINKKN